MTNFLLTNDDGITAPGIWAAARALAPLGRVLIVAPNHNYSGYGAALPPTVELATVPYTPAQGHIPGVTAIALAAPPATCVQVGLSGALSRRPIDVVVSGINDTLNIGRDVLYSGTVGAAFTAHLRNVPALAVSLDGSHGVLHWDTAAWAIREMVLKWQSQPPAAPLLLNLNVPNVPLKEMAGIQMTFLSSQSCLDRYQLSHCSEHRVVFDRLPSHPMSTFDKGSDAWAVARSYLSITPLRLFPDVISLVSPGESMTGALPSLDTAGSW